MNKEILYLANNLIKEEGYQSTFLKDVSLFKSKSYIKKTPYLYDTCLIIVLQGEKKGYLGEHVITYNTKKYFVVPTTMPFEYETFASEDQPFLCIKILIDKKVMYEIIDLLSKEEIIRNKKSILGVFSDDMTSEIELIISKLLKALSSINECKLLGDSYIKELYYHIATGENADFLHKMFLNNKVEAKIARSLRTICEQYNEKLDISTLARIENMSVSSFHTHFKRITSLTPLQYIKKIRLNKAKDLISRYNYQVNETAEAVGYESISQFSRDFKLFFGYSPSDIKNQ